MSNPRMDQNENDRRMSGMIGVGKIVDVNLNDYTARVRDGDLTTGWLRMGMMRAFGDQMTWPYKVGEEVGYASISGDMQEGFIFCSLANGQNVADASVDVLRARADGGFELTGDVTIIGNLDVSDDISAGGDIHADGDVTADDISLQDHVHSGVDRGGSDTDKPR